MTIYPEQQDMNLWMYDWYLETEVLQGLISVELYINLSWKRCQISQKLPNIYCICVLLCFIMQVWIVIAKRQNQGQKDQKRARDWKDRKSRSQRSRKSQKFNPEPKKSNPDQDKNLQKPRSPIKSPKIT